MQTQFSLRARRTFEPVESISLGTVQTILTVLALTTAVLALFELALA